MHIVSERNESSLPEIHSIFFKLSHSNALPKFAMGTLHMAILEIYLHFANGNTKTDYSLRGRGNNTIEIDVKAKTRKKEKRCFKHTKTGGCWP